MTKERIKELLSTIKDKEIIFGICFEIKGLDISEKESIKLYNWFQKQKPRKRKNYQFTKSEYFTHIDRNWWTRDEQGNKERIKFLEHLINKL